MNFAGMAEKSLVHKYGGSYAHILKGQHANAGVRSKEETRAGVKAAAEEFESIFVYQMLSAMRKTVGDGSLIPKSNAQKIFEGMLDEEWSRKLAGKTGPGGISEILYRQLSRQLGLEEEDSVTAARAPSVKPSATAQLRQLADQLGAGAPGVGLGPAGYMGEAATMSLLEMKSMNPSPPLMLQQQR